MKGARKGTVLGMTLVVLMALVILGLALIARTRTVLDSSARERDRLLALHAAEAGVNLAVYWLENDRVTDWNNLVDAHQELQRTDLPSSYFEVQDITRLSEFTALVRSDGYSRSGRSPQKRTVAVKVRVLPFGGGLPAMAAYGEAKISGGGAAKVYGSMYAGLTSGAAINIQPGSSFTWTPLTNLDSVDTPGTISDPLSPPYGIPDACENPGAPPRALPDVDYTHFQSTTLFPNARIYNVLPVDFLGTTPSTDDDVATDPSKGVLPKLAADGSVTWYYTYRPGKGGKINDQWTVAQFNTAFTAGPAYGLPAKDYAIVNWRTGVDADKNGVIDDYRLHLSGNGTITATIAIYGDSGDPLNPNDNGSLKISGGATFEPATGVAIVANGVDLEKITGNVELGTQANPALVLATGWSRWGSGGTVNTVGSLIVGGDIEIIGNSSHWFNSGFIDKMPENMQEAFVPPGSASRFAYWLTWQVL